MIKVGACSIPAILASVALTTLAQPVYAELVEDEGIGLSTNRAVELDASVAATILDALQYNPQIALAVSDRKTAYANRFDAAGSFLPSIEGSVSYTDNNWRSNVLETLEDRDGVTLGLTVSQPIFQGGSTVNRFLESQSRVQQSNYQLDDTKEQVAFLAAQAHASVLLSRDILKHRQANYSLVSQQYEVTKARFEAGAQSRTGVEQARSRMATANVAVEQAKAGLAGSEASFARIVGRQAGQLRYGEEVLQSKLFQTLEEAIGAALTNNPALSAAKKGVNAAKRGKNAAQGDLAPKVSLDASYFQRDYEEMADTDDDEYQVVARMRMPIFNQGKNIAGVKRASAGVESARAQLLQARLAIEEQVTRTWYELEAAIIRREMAETAVEAASLSLEGLKIEYEAGRRTVTDVLDGQRDLVEAQVSLSQTLFDLQVARFELAAVTGQLAASAASVPLETQ